MKFRALAALLILGAAFGYGCAHGPDSRSVSATVPTVDLNRIKYDRQCFTIDGKDTFIYSGSFHYFRCPKPLWADRFQKMKEAGLNCVETYVAWNWHEQQPPAGLDDFSKMDMTDLKDWLDMAINRFGFYVILRPGPYICAEWDGGGYPQWLVTKRPAGASPHWLRSDNPAYLDWCKHWFTAAAKATVPFQITHMPAGKPGVILWQIENEYDYAAFPPEVKLHQLQALAHDSRDLGIDIPLNTCQTSNDLFRQDPYLLQNVIECRNTYPRFDANNELRSLSSLLTYQPEKLKIVTELQGGWFSDVGGQLSQAIGLTPQQITHVTLLPWALGYTATNYYMMFGGTNFGDWGSAFRTTSYDYDAPIREPGGVGPRYLAVQAMGQFLRLHSAQLVRAETVDISADPAPDGVSVFLRRAPSGERFLFIINNLRNDRSSGTLHLSSKDAGFDGSVDYNLDPFDGKILYLPAGESDPSKGQWYPEPPVAPAVRPAVPQEIPITIARRKIDPGPTAESWQDLPQGGSVEDVGIFDRRFVYYRTNLPATAQPGMLLSARVQGQDFFLAQLNDQPLDVSRHGRGTLAAPLPVGVAGPLLALYENGGRDNGGDGINARCGLINTAICSADLLPKTLGRWFLKIEDGDPTNDISASVDSSWKRTRVNDQPNQVLGGQTGVFRTEIDLTDDEAKADGRVLSFGNFRGEHKVYFNGQSVSEADPNQYNVSKLTRPGSNSVAVIVTAATRPAGISDGVELDPVSTPQSAIAWQISGETAGTAGKWWDSNLDDSQWESINLPDSPSAGAGPTSLCWYRFDFELPSPASNVWVPWKLHLKGTGNGFIYLNGHALGRFWEVGPQWDFYMPECWLNFGPGSKNVVTLCFRATKTAPQIKEASVSPYAEFAEFR